MKKLFVLIISCCFAVLLAACSDRNGGGNEGKEEYEAGVVLQVCDLSESATENKSFEDKDGLKTYITESFADSSYFCVFGDGESSEVFHNTYESSTYNYGVDLCLGSTECLLVYNVYYNPLTARYSLNADAPLTTNTQIALEIKIGASGNYKLNVNVIPKQPQNEKLTLNNPVSKTVKAGQTEYFYLSSEISGPCDLTVSGSGDFEVGLYVDGKEGIVGSLTSGPVAKASYYLFEGREYRLAVHSYGGDSEVNIELENACALELGKEAEYEVVNSRYFTFTAQVSSEVIFGVRSDDVFKITLYDDDNKFLAETSDSDEFSRYVERGKKYFVLITNYSHGDSNVKIYTQLNPANLKFGSQGLYLPTKENCYSFTPNVTAEYIVSLSDNEATIFDYEWNRVEQANGRYALEAETVYLVIITGSVNEFTVDIGLNYSADAEGVIPYGGEVIVKFVPDVTASYSVVGAENVDWYSSDLVKTDSWLSKGKTYFVKITGEKGGNYSLIREYTAISVDRLFNLFEGAYKFTIESAGDYTITFYTTKNVEFNLYNTEGEKLKGYDGGHGEITVNLAVGEYTFDLSVSEADSVGIIIN